MLNVHLNWRKFTFYLLVIGLMMSACAPQGALLSAGAPAAEAEVPVAGEQLASMALVSSPPQPTPTSPSTRPLYAPGELVDYIAQAGDTIPLLAARFNTSESEIREANSFIPPSVTTMPPGMPMKIPIYYLPLWGPSYNILPDSLFVDGPAQVGFDIQSFVAQQPGWLKDYVEYAAGANRNGAQIVDYVALRYSVSPRLLLALLEYQAGALSNPELSPENRQHALGYLHWDHQGLYLQLNWAANLLNNGYYGFRSTKLLSIEYKDGRLERFDPWLNAASASLHNYFNKIYAGAAYELAISAQGLASTYRALFGDPWQADQPHIPGSLAQPELSLPFEPGNIWAFTGGPHSAWGKDEPLAALDFAPPTMAGGCLETSEWATAIAAGTIVRSESGAIVLDLDGDGDERTGWSIFYLHLANDGRAALGAVLQRGDPVGHPSCEGGRATGTHVHIARKYNGEWILAEGILAFDLEGWVAFNGRQPYQGALRRETQTVTACVCSNQASFIQSEPR